MYHFLFIVSKKLFPNGFDVTYNVDEKKEQIIDFCPKCNEKLEDKRIITLRKHDKTKHPKSEKQLLKRFYTKGSMPMFLVLGIVIILGTITFVSINISNQMWEDSLSIEEKEYRIFCSELIDSMPQYADFWIFDERKPITLERGQFVLENLNDFEKCYYSPSLSSLGDKKERIEYFNSIENGK